MQNEWRELKMVEDFKGVKNANQGFIVITDNANGNKVHKPSCVWVKEDNFIKKVMTNNNSQGCYYWISDKEADLWNATPCKKCW